MASPNTSLVTGREAYDVLFNQLSEEGLMDITQLGHWRLSSWRPGCGLRQLLDSAPTAFWQTDGDLPHYIEIQFSKFIEVAMIAVFVDFSEDESYTPCQLRVLAGFGRNDLVEVDKFEIEMSQGWSCLLLGYLDSFNKMRPIKCMFLKIEILQNHQNGKDTHVRGLRIVGPSNNKDEQKSFKLSPIGMRL